MATTLYGHQYGNPRKLYKIVVIYEEKFVYKRPLDR